MWQFALDCVVSERRSSHSTERSLLRAPARGTAPGRAGFAVDTPGLLWYGMRALLRSWRLYLVLPQ